MHFELDVCMDEGGWQYAHLRPVSSRVTIWDDSALPRERFRELNNHITRRVIEIALQAAGCPCDFLVDAACGKGGGLPKYVPSLPRGASCVLVDISEGSVREAKHRVKRFQKHGVIFSCEVQDCFAPEY